MGGWEQAQEVLEVVGLSPPRRGGCGRRAVEGVLGVRSQLFEAGGTVSLSASMERLMEPCHLCTIAVQCVRRAAASLVHD